MMADQRLLGQFRVSQAVALYTLAAALRRGAGPARAEVGWVQAVLVSADGGSPPTCTVTFDQVTNVPGVRYMRHYTPVVGDVVEVQVRSGNLLIFGAKA